MAEADPQASVLSSMTGVELETVQTALTLFVALLIEIGSGFGMYVAFAYWRHPEPARRPAPQPHAAAVQPARKEESRQRARSMRSADRQGRSDLEAQPADAGAARRRRCARSATTTTRP